MNRKGQADIQAIIGGIISIFFLIVFLSAMIPVFQSLTGADEKQAEIKELKDENSALNQQIDNMHVELSQLRGFLDSLNSTIEEKDNKIANLSGQISEKEKQIKELQEELSSYQEKVYLSSINNNYYNILNYVERIENKFYTINLAIGLISLTLFGMVIKMFGLDVTFKMLFKRLKRKKRD